MSTGFGQLPLRLRRRYLVLFIHQGISSSDFSLIGTVTGFGVSAYAPKADAAIVAKIASIAIMVS